MAFLPLAGPPPPCLQRVGIVLQVNQRSEDCGTLTKQPYWLCPLARQEATGCRRKDWSHGGGRPARARTHTRHGGGHALNHLR